MDGTAPAAGKATTPFLLVLPAMRTWSVSNHASPAERSMTVRANSQPSPSVQHIGGSGVSISVKGPLDSCRRHFAQAVSPHAVGTTNRVP